MSVIELLQLLEIIAKELGHRTYGNACEGSTNGEPLFLRVYTHYRGGFEITVRGERLVVSGGYAGPREYLERCGDEEFDIEDVDLWEKLRFAVAQRLGRRLNISPSMVIARPSDSERPLSLDEYLSRGRSRAD
jgi:hypothetical protein